MAISQYGNEYYGLSGDVKPLGTPLNGRKFTEMDTSKEYRFDAENQQWLQQSGPSGGSSTLSGLTDVDISNPSDGQTLVYNASAGKWENGAAGGGGGGPLLVNFAYDETSDSYPGDKTAGEVLASCEQYGFAMGICDGATNVPLVITAQGGANGIICKRAGFAGVNFDEFEDFKPDPTQLVYYYQPNEAITGYYHGEG
jgi:hypothetical protein